MTARGVAHLVVHGTSGSTSYETIPHVRLETSGDVLSTVDMVVQRRDGPRRLCDDDDDDDDYPRCSSLSHQTHAAKCSTALTRGYASRRANISSVSVQLSAPSADLVAGTSVYTDVLCVFSPSRRRRAKI